MARTIAVIVKPKARKPEIVKVSPEDYRIAVREPAQNGRANEAAKTCFLSICAHS
jgi:uncharacterized protein YggU (UPF0235/DUF167 family)